MTDNIAGKVVVITGASSGLGEAAARELARKGAVLVLGARRIDRLRRLADELSLGNDAAVETDVTKFGQVTKLVDHAVRRHGCVDVMINNAGVMPHSTLDQLRVEDWSWMVDVNIKGVLHGIAAALPHMQSRRSGHIINVSSVAGHKVRPGAAVYAATKGAVRTISEGLRQEMTRWNIRVTVISPGAVNTELAGSITDPNAKQMFEDYYAETAIGADSFARCVAFAIEQPDDVGINEILYRPTRQEF